ncbi:hypothetical protein TrLO_g14882 [Triparma laevis f. longispina]|uniref:Calcineurin-like phosphoesterase domain-containing protein n=1 Tax=Triparma laevis f. longispina TaxID=1714387 RepID=A0A9W7L0A0_9STRA|nr:hypothetical protein TrLO_g14882 [Triparma laevis f. longispina]
MVWHGVMDDMFAGYYDFKERNVCDHVCLWFMEEEDDEPAPELDLSNCTFNAVNASYCRFEWWIGDDWCDVACNNSACGFDGGDCASWGGGGGLPSLYATDPKISTTESSGLPEGSFWSCRDVYTHPLTTNSAGQIILDEFWTASGEIASFKKFLKCDHALEEKYNELTTMLLTTGFFVKILIPALILFIIEMALILRSYFKPKFTAIRHKSSSSSKEVEMMGGDNNNPEVSDAGLVTSIVPAADHSVTLDEVRISDRTSLTEENKEVGAAKCCKCCCNACICCTTPSKLCCLKYFGFSILVIITWGAVMISATSLAENMGAETPWFMMHLTPTCSANNCQDVESFRREDGFKEGEGENFTVLIASDSQLDWFDGEFSIINAEYPECCDPSDSLSACTTKVGIHTNMEQVKSFGTIPEADTVFNNGDLTAWFHPHEFYYFMQDWHSLPSNIKSFYPSLGNHDYINNLGGGSFFGDEWSSESWNELNNACCAQHAVQYMRCGIKGEAGWMHSGIPKFDSSKLTSFDSNSLSYSHTRGRYHFIHVNYEPVFENYKIGISNSFAWLSEDIKIAREAGLKIVLISHDGYMFGYTERVVQDAGGVDVVFAGHLHRCLGTFCEMPTPSFSGNDRCKASFKDHWPEGFGGNHWFLDEEGDMECNSYGPGSWSFAGAPIVWSGSSSYQNYLQADFGPNGINIKAMSSVGGVARREEAGSLLHPYHDDEDLEFLIAM